MKSRNVYFATLRMLGATKNDSRQLLALELFHVFNLAFIAVMVFAYLLTKGYIHSFIPNLESDILYLTYKDYILLYITVAIICILISLRYARQLFKDSATVTYKETE